MAFTFDSPKSFRVRELSRIALSNVGRRQFVSQSTPSSDSPIWAAVANTTMDALVAHESHPNFAHLAGLVSEAVLEVVFVALPGFLVAVTGMFDANSQKFVAELNTMVFTPCLIFTKLAGQLNADVLGDLIVIPFIFAMQTLVSWLAAQAMARVFGFNGKDKKMQKNFVLAMGIFGNSNSLPISLVLSLSKTISGLHWNQIPGDNDDEVGARGILYLLIFQQLGQLLRWTWGYSVLLRPASAYEQEEREEDAENVRAIEDGPYSDESENDTTAKYSDGPIDSGFNSGSQTPLMSGSQEDLLGGDEEPQAIVATGNNPSTEPRNLASHEDEHLWGMRSRSNGHMTAFPSFSRSVTMRSDSSAPEISGWKAPLYRASNKVVRVGQKTYFTVSTFSNNLWRKIPEPVQKPLAVVHYYNTRFWAGVWRQMNPPLWAMLAALVVASVPSLQRAFFTKGTLINNSVTRAISQSGGVAVPLILVVLGANLARSTIPKDQLATSKEDKREERRLLYASILSRMVIPVIVMAPLLALAAKYIPVSIMDDPIFIIVCFLLTGAPSALQLAQICQINNVFMGAMSSLLVASYVVVIFPSTLLLVLMALEVLEWTVI